LGVVAKEKMHIVWNKNPGLNLIKLIRDVHCGINRTLLQTELTVSEISAKMKFAPITSVKIERSFSRYKSVYYGQILENLILTIWVPIWYILLLQDQGE